MSLSEPMVMRDIVVSNIIVVPFRYIPNEKQLEVYESIDIQIEEIGDSEDIRVRDLPKSRVFENIYKKFGAPIKGDILLTSVGTLGVPYLVKKDDKFYFKDGNLTWFKNFNNIINNCFLYYWLRSEIAKIKFDEVTIGSTQKALTIVALKSIEIHLPPLKIQNNIVKILDSLEGKLINNRKTNETLEKLAQALFKSWFVDFDPVKAKAKLKEEDGNLDSIAKELDMSKEILELFPDEFEESRVGLIPKGWEVTKLGDISEKITKGTTPSKKDILKISNEEEDVIPFLKVKDISITGEINKQNLEFIAKSIHLGVLKRSILKESDILFSIAGTIGRIAIVDKNLTNANTNQAIGIIRLSEVNKHLGLVWLSLKSDKVQHDINSKLVQGVQANASLTNLRDISIIIPTDNLLLKWNFIVVNLMKALRKNREQSSNLTELRDSLLPKLLSGEITIEKTGINIDE